MPLYIYAANLFVMTLVFLSQFTPTAYIKIKIVLIAFAVLTIIPGLLTKKLFYLKEQVCGIFFLAFFGAVYSIYGVIQENPGAIRVMTLWTVWPLFYLFLSALLMQPSAFFVLAKTLSVSLAAVVIYAYLYLGYVLGLVPEYLYPVLDQGQTIGFYGGRTEIRLHSISSLIFLSTFYFHYVLESYRTQKKVTFKQAILISLTLILIILSGRRVLLLNLLLLPFVILLVNNFIHNKFRIKIRLSGVIVITVAIGLSLALINEFGVNLSSVWSVFAGGFDFTSTEESVADRRSIFLSLVSGWINSSLLFGAGNGAVASFVSSEAIPWAYELTYIYLLFSTGVIGVVIYFGWYGYSLLRVRTEMRNVHHLTLYVGPFLTGSISFCIAAATNPYFSKFDFLWIVMLPFFLAGWAKYQTAEGSG